MQQPLNCMFIDDASIFSKKMDNMEEMTKKFDIKIYKKSFNNSIGLSLTRDPDSSIL